MPSSLLCTKMSSWRVLGVVAVVLAVVSGEDELMRGRQHTRSINQFPPDFHFMTATASYQVEGAWNLNGKGENIWDRYTHQSPNKVADGSNADVTTDSYHRYQEDINALNEMGVKFYRFSLSWSRLLPTGYIDKINPDGVRYYNELINALLFNGITPVVTLYHWDLPQPLQDLGGWPNEALVDYFLDYANLAFTTFGDRVKWWITFNEPTHVSAGYADGPQFAPGLNGHGIADYLSTHNIIKAHARAYRLYDHSYRKTQKGKVGITLHTSWYEPLTPSPTDKEASERAMQFELGWFMHPIFSAVGDYPKVMKTMINSNSKKESRARSRLPTFSKEWVTFIRGTWDFLGLNHYTTSLVTTGELGEYPSRSRDSNTMSTQDANWEQGASPWLKVVPWGLRKLLNWIKKEYNNPTVFITENGVSDHGELNDTIRITYYSGYLSEVLKAINQDGCNVIGYTAWSLIDNFEWTRGYKDKFGLYYVDVNDPKRPRIAKESSRLMAEFIRTNSVPLRYFRNDVETFGITSNDEPLYETSDIRYSTFNNRY